MVFCVSPHQQRREYMLPPPAPFNISIDATFSSTVHTHIHTPLVWHLRCCGSTGVFSSPSLFIPPRDPSRLRNNKTPTLPPSHFSIPRKVKKTRKLFCSPPFNRPLSSLSFFPPSVCLCDVSAAERGRKETEMDRSKKGNREEERRGNFLPFFL